MLKKFLSLTLSFLIIFSLISPHALAQQDDREVAGDSELWNEMDRQYEIEVIPSETTDAALNAINPFTDVATDDWYYDAVLYVHQNELFNGISQHTFSPNGTMTRAMFVTVLGRMAGIDAGEYTDSSFTDVERNIWYTPYIQWAVKQGITNGTGNGLFSPNTPINREQMATFMIRYLQKYNIELPEGNHNNAELKDISNVSSWALSAVQELWQAGLITGDADGNFNPLAYAKRVEAAALIMRGDVVIKNNVTPTPTPTSTPTPSSPASGPVGTPSSGTYTITFNTNGGSELSPLTVNSGETLRELPSSYKQDHNFMGWYTNVELTTPVLADTKVVRNMNLYAAYELEPTVNRSVEPQYGTISKLDQPEDFSVNVTSTTSVLTADEVKAGLSLTLSSEDANIAATALKVTGSNGTYLIQGTLAQDRFEPGTMHYLVLTDERLQFDGEETVVRQLAFSLKKEEFSNLELNPNLISIPADQVDNMVNNGEVVAPTSLGFQSLSLNKGANQLSGNDESSGTFTYSGSTVLDVGDTVAIYEGRRPEDRSVTNKSDQDGQISYVKIIEKNGSVYTYETPEYEDILSIPDILPVNINYDTDGNLTDNSITISRNLFTNEHPPLKDIDIDSNLDVNAGDFILLFTTDALPANIEDASGMSTFQKVVRITSVQSTDQTYTIAFNNSTMEELLQSGDSYEKLTNVREEAEPAIDPATLKKMEEQVIASGFVEAATEQLIATTIQTESYKELEAEFDLPTEEIQQFMLSNKASSEKGRVSIEVDDPKFETGLSSEHTDNMTVSEIIKLEIGATVTIDTGKNTEVKIKLTGTFQQEIGVEADIETDYWIGFWHKKKGIWAEGSVKLFSYTAIGINAKIGLFEKGEEPDWDEEEDISEDLKEILKLQEAVEDSGEEIGDIATSLAEQYADMLEEDTEYVQIVKQSLGVYVLASSWGIFNLELYLDFVVEAKLNVSLGINISYMISKSVDFTLDSRKDEKFKYKVNDLEQKFLLNLYVMGELGIRAGIQADLYASIIKKDLAGAGARVKLGLYAEMYGFFYYQFEAGRNGTKNKLDGAIYFELGVFVEAGLLVSTLITDESYLKLADFNIKIFSAGEEKPIIGFPDLEEDDIKGNEEIDMGSQQQFKLPKFATELERMSMTTGTLSVAYKDPSEFTFTFDDTDFTYNRDKKTIVYTGLDGYAETEMTIIWNKGKQLFGSDPHSTTISVKYGEPEEYYSVSIFTVKEAGQEASLLQKFRAEYTEEIEISAPARSGYQFVGWYSDENGKTPATLPTEMPGRNLVFYSKWKANDMQIYVENFMEVDSGRYQSLDLPEVRTISNVLNSAIMIVPSEIEGYVTPPAKSVTITEHMLPVQFLYNKKTFTVQFQSGVNGVESVNQLIKFEQVATPPNMTRSDYVLKEWELVSGNGPNRIGASEPIQVRGNAVYKAVWEKRTYKATFNADGGVGGTTNNIAAGDPIVAPVVTKEGYVFLGWSPALPSVMPGQAQTYKALWQSESSPAEVNYKVEYYTEDLVVADYFDEDYDREFTYAKTYTKQNEVTLSGIVGSEVNAEVITLTGFTYDSTHLGNVLSGTVNSDDQLTLKVYYSRNVYDLKFVEQLDYGDGEIYELVYGYYVGDEYYDEYKVKYGNFINMIDMEEDYHGEGGLFGGWRPEGEAPKVEVPNSVTMPAQNVTYVMVYAPE